MNLYLITGTTKGLGAALSELLARDTENLVIGLSRAATSPKSSVGPHNVFVDLADIASIGPAFAACEALFAGMRVERAVLINNAGLVVPFGGFDSLDAIETAKNINVNLTAPMVLMRLFANATRDVGSHRLVLNISSGAAKRPLAGWSAYCAAKAGLEMATRAAALEASVRDPSLAICSLAPGVVDTPMQAQVRGATAEQFPDVARFRAMKLDGALRPAEDVARDIVKLIQENKLSNGGNFDFRELTA